MFSFCNLQIYIYMWNFVFKLMRRDCLFIFMSGEWWGGGQAARGVNLHHIHQEQQTADNTCVI